MFLKLRTPFHLPSSKFSVTSTFAVVQFRAESGKRLGPNSHTSFTYHNQFLHSHRVHLASRNSWWLTNRIAFPSPPALAKACAVQHMPLIMTLVEGLVHIIGDTVHDALVCLRQSRDSLSVIALNVKTKSFCLAHRSRLLISLQRLTMTRSIHAKGSPPDICDHHRLVLHTHHCSRVHLSAVCK